MEFLGILTFLDPPRPDTKHTIDCANDFGVSVKMITGDHRAIAVETCRVLGMGTNVLGQEKLPLMKAEDLECATTLGRDYGELCRGADGFAQVFPEHKYLIVESLRQQGFLTGMTGDGVNDAPALKRADVGIAVQGATNAAQAAADIVLTEPGLSTIVTAIVTSRKIFQPMKNFVIYRIATRSCSSSSRSCIFYHGNEYNEDWPSYFYIPGHRHRDDHHPERRHDQVATGRNDNTRRLRRHLPELPGRAGRRAHRRDRRRGHRRQQHRVGARPHPGAPSGTGSPWTSSRCSPRPSPLPP